MQCTCTDMNKSLVGLFTHVPSMTSEKKTVGLWTGYRIVMSVNKIKLQSQGCSSSSTPWIKTYPATRKSFSKLTRATQQQQQYLLGNLLFQYKVILIQTQEVQMQKRLFASSVVCEWATKTFWVKLYSSFLSQLQVYRTTKIFWVHILCCLAKDVKLFTPRLNTLVSKCPV